MPDILSSPSLHDVLRQRVPRVWVTHVLVAINLLVYLAMLVQGGGLWHSANGVALAWGANFAPATQDGQWWRLISAMFLHFGLPHLLMNLWALWDGGQLVERMYGHLRFALLYFFSGVAGNLLSLVIHHDPVVSGGASGAIFGVYAALLVCLWRERLSLQPHEFRWLFFGAAGFAGASTVLGLLLTGIDNAAHIGGFVAGLLAGIGLVRPVVAMDEVPRRPQLMAGALSAVAVLLLISRIPAPAYRWSEEAMTRQALGRFIEVDAEARGAWQDIMSEARRGGISFDELAGRIDSTVGNSYAESFEQLSQLPVNPSMPSANSLEVLRHYAQLRRDASRGMAEGLRHNDPRKMREAMALDSQSRALLGRAAGNGKTE